MSIFVVQNGGLSVKLQLGSRILHGIKEAAKRTLCLMFETDSLGLSCSIILYLLILVVSVVAKFDCSFPAA